MIEENKKSLASAWINRRIISDKRLIEAFMEIPRENFVPEDLKDEAYSDYPLPIGDGQTISQPTTVMIMINALELKGNDKVLEIGAGSGYAAALMSRIAKVVYAVEIIPGLADTARKNLDKTGINNAYVVNSDGSLGYEKEAPYDKIIVSAGCPKIPPALIRQLNDNGIIVAPVSRYGGYEMIKAIKNKNILKKESLGSFSFVPLRGRFGYG